MIHGTRKYFSHEHRDESENGLKAHTRTGFWAALHSGFVYDFPYKYLRNDVSSRRVFI